MGSSFNKGASATPPRPQASSGMSTIDQPSMPVPGQYDGTGGTPPPIGSATGPITQPQPQLTGIPAGSSFGTPSAGNTYGDPSVGLDVGWKPPTLPAGTPMPQYTGDFSSLFNGTWEGQPSPDDLAQSEAAGAAAEASAAANPMERLRRPNPLPGEDPYFTPTGNVNVRDAIAQLMTMFGKSA